MGVGAKSELAIATATAPCLCGYEAKSMACSSPARGPKNGTGTLVC